MKPNRGGLLALPLAFPASGGAGSAGGEAGPAREEPVRPSVPRPYHPPSHRGGFLSKWSGRGGLPALPLAPPASGEVGSRPEGTGSAEGGRSLPSLNLSLSLSLSRHGRRKGGEGLTAVATGGATAPDGGSSSSLSRSAEMKQWQGSMKMGAGDAVV